MIPEIDYRTAREAISSRTVPLFDSYNRFLEARFGPGDIREHFLLDGSPVISRSGFLSLPQPLQHFFNDERMALPPSQHVFEAGNHEGKMARVKSLHGMVALRGFRFYGADGKYPWGPNEKYALDLLTENVVSDKTVIPHITTMETTSRDSWLAKLAAWDYVRNDLSAVYYLKACRDALDSTNDADGESLAHIDRMLEAANTNYLNTLFLLPEVPVDLADFDQAAALLHESSSFVQEHSSDDVIRFHRELGNPHAVLFAFHIMYGTRKIHDSDLLAAPLYGAIDIGHSFRYVMRYGDDVYKHITGESPPSPAVSREIVFFHHKIIPRGKPRSEMAGVHVTNPKGLFLLDTTPPDIVEKFAKAQNILFIDDSAGTFGSRNDVLKWLQNTVGPKTCDWVIAHGGTRWAKAQNASLQEIVEAEAVAATPLSKKFKNPCYGGGMSGYMPDAVIATMMLRTERTALTLAGAQNILLKLHAHGVLHGVGYDLYETLVRRTVTREQRRADLNEMAAAIVSGMGYPVSASEYESITRPVWTGDIASMAQTHQEIDYFTTLHKMIREIMRQKQYAADQQTEMAIADAVAQAEFSYEKGNTIPNEGMHDLLRAMSSVGVTQGIYSNTPYPENIMHEIIGATGIPQYIPHNHILVSSATGVVKPGAKSMTLLSNAMEVNIENTAFIDNASTGVTAAMCARAIPIHYLFPEENLPLRKRIEGWQEFVREIDYRAAAHLSMSVSK